MTSEEEQAEALAPFLNMAQALKYLTNRQAAAGGALDNYRREQVPLRDDKVIFELRGEPLIGAVDMARITAGDLERLLIAFNVPA